MKTLELIRSLSKDEVSELNSVPKIEGSDVLQKLLLALQGLSKKNKGYDKELVFRKTFGEAYDPKKDHVLRKRLSELNKCLDELIIKKEFNREVGESQSLKSLYRLKSYDRRKLYGQFDLEFEGAFKHAKENLQNEIAAEMLDLFFNRTKNVVSNQHEQTAYGKLSREQQQLVLKHANRKMKKAEMMTIFFENGGRQLEDRDTNYHFEHQSNVDLASPSTSDPITEYHFHKGLQLIAKSPKERIPILNKCVELLEDCNVEGFDNTREAAVMHHTLGVCYIDLKKWDEALASLRKSAELEIEYRGHYTPPVVACLSSTLYQLGRHEEVVDLISDHTGTFDSFSRDALKVHKAYSLLKLERLKEVRELIDSMESGADQIQLASRNLLIKCLYQEGKTAAALTEYENLIRTSRDRKHKGLYDYFFECLKPLGQFLTIRLEPESVQKKGLTELERSILSRLKSGNVSNTEDYLYDWLLTEIGR